MAKAPARAGRKTKGARGDKPSRTRKATTPRAKNAQRKSRKRRPVEFPPAFENERVLALDTSSSCIGWSLFEHGQLIDYGKWVVLGKGHGEKRLRFREWLHDKLVETSPHHLILEKPFAGRFPGAFAVLIRYVGVVEEVHVEHFGDEIPPANEVEAHLIKKTIGAAKGRGKNHDAVHDSNKVIVLALVNERFRLSLKWKQDDRKKTTTEDDIADAIALNWAWHLLYRSPAEVTE
jgi:hypothetical protein